MYEQSSGPTSANDLERLQQLEQRIDGRLRGHVQYFRVVRGPNGLVLRGVARSYYAKQLAQQAVMEASRLPIAANEIHVSSPRGTGR